jgi:hypothetical protein
MIWVSEMKDGKPTGRLYGYSTMEEAKRNIDFKRQWRDKSPQYKAFKEGNYDWNILEEIGDEGHGSKEYKVHY